MNTHTFSERTGEHTFSRGVGTAAAAAAMAAAHSRPRKRAGQL